MAALTLPETTAYFTHMLHTSLLNEAKIPAGFYCNLYNITPDDLFVFYSKRSAF